MSSLKEIFDRQFAEVEFDAAFCARVIRFSNWFMTKNHDHVEFFGGVLIGVNPLRFLESDRDQWFNDVLTIDEGALKEDFRRNATSVNMSFNVMSDVFNYTSLYVCHRLFHNRTLPPKLRTDAMVHSIMVLHYRFLTGLLVRRFRYPANREIAQAAYNSLSRRYDIRRYPSWRALLEARGYEIALQNMIYRNAIAGFKPDAKVIYTVTTTQGRIREVINKQFSVYVDTIERGERIHSQSSTMVTTDGETILRDKTNGFDNYVRFMGDVIQTRNDFIKPVLVDIITSVVKNCPKETLVASLEYIGQHVNEKRYGYLSELVNKTLVYLFDFLSKDPLLLRRNDLAAILSKLHIQYTASRAGDPVVLSIRSLADKLVKSAHHTKTPSVVTATRTAVLMYLSLRALTKDQF